MLETASYRPVIGGETTPPLEQRTRTVFSTAYKLQILSEHAVLCATGWAWGDCCGA